MCAITVKVVRKSELEAKKWSGGVTTQLAIWPEGADYASRKFGWRISSAIVEEEESTFTALPGVHRHLMLLDGGIELTHESIAPKKMKPLTDVAEFEGEWLTNSKGRCVDFNLMTTEGYAGSMAPVPAGGNSVMLRFSQSPLCWHGIYAVTDDLTIAVDAPDSAYNETLDAGDFFLMSYTPNNCGEIFLTISPAVMDVPAVAASVWVVPEGVDVVWDE